jgi:hypothetical protein
VGVEHIDTDDEIKNKQRKPKEFQKMSENKECPTIIDSETYTAEASESAKRAQADKVKPDKTKAELEALLAKNKEGEALDENTQK